MLISSTVIKLRTIQESFVYMTPKTFSKNFPYMSRKTHASLRAQIDFSYKEDHVKYKSWPGYIVKMLAIL